jgi:cyclophilin family peptidyl-prolyl cis-trans isomerase
LLPTTVVVLLLAIQTPAGPPPTTQPEAPGGEAAAALDTLQNAFRNLYTSLEAKRGIAPEDREAIRSLRDRFTAFNEQWAGQDRGLAGELQLTIWLADHDRVDELFAQLAQLRPGNTQIGLAWADYFRRINDRKRVDRIFARLVELYPDDVEVRVSWAQNLKGLNAYGKAIEVLTVEGFEPTERPAAALALSDCLFAEQRYQEAVDVLEAIPPETLAADLTVSRLIDRVMPDRRGYPELWAQEQEIRAAEAAADDLPRAELVTPRGRVVVELFENEAPNTVANFISLAEAGYYDGTRFHRVIPNFMAQGGDPNSRKGASGVPGRGGPGYRIPDEHDREGARNHFTGSLAMANSGTPHSGGSQFYITHTPPAHLNGKHTVFGRVIEGLEVARGIEGDDTLETVTVLRKRDHDYEPQTLPETPATQPGPGSTPSTIPSTTRPQDSP